MALAADERTPSRSGAQFPPELFRNERAALLDRICGYNPNADRALIGAAFDFGAARHANQPRADGGPYFRHPIAVAGILADLRLDDSSIATALLHDVVEDTDATREDVARLFGPEIAELVAGVTKLGQIENREGIADLREAAQAENFRKLILAVAQDARVLLVKLADRLHNMRTLGALADHKRRRIAKETMEVYAPLAGRMGMQTFREELEDLAIRILAPGARTSVLRRFVRMREELGGRDASVRARKANIDTAINKVREDLRAALAENGVEASVHGRLKRPYSIWRKTSEKKEGFESLSDIVGFRVIVSTVEDCYRALGAIHRRWRVVPGRIKDYISTPKRNGYASIHTIVVSAEGWRIEVQIRTPEMHEAAERGVAAHWSYRDGRREDNPYAVGPTLWLKDVLQKLEQGAPPTEFLEHVKLEMYHDQVFCFTPKGRVIGLPRGATALDFAYAVHTRIGHTCVGARIDGHRAPFWKELRNGQTVSILRSENQNPAPDWEEMVVTGRAKAAIRRALRDRERDELERFGDQLLHRAFAKAGYDLHEQDLERACAALGLEGGPAALRVEVGASRLAAEDALRAAQLDRDASEEIARREEPAVFLRGKNRRSLAHRFCPDCQPIPFERIVGVPDHERGGAVIHRIDCARLEEDEENADRWLDTFWGDHADAAARYKASLRLIIGNEPGALGEVCVSVGDLGANIADLQITERKPSFYRIWVDLEVKDARHLHKILKTLDNLPRVDHVERVSEPADAGDP